MESKTKLRFELEESKTVCNIFRGDQHIGRIWAEYESTKKTTLPYPHDENSAYCQNSIQICGFDHISQTWGCGPFAGKKDCVIHFLPTDEDYYEQKAKEYAEYVKNFFSIKVKTLKSGVGEFHVADSEVSKERDITKVKSFADWLDTGGCL
jgi:hypothetical protein